MISEDLIKIPVVDEGNRIIGDLTLSEILNEGIYELK